MGNRFLAKLRDLPSETWNAIFAAPLKWLGVLLSICWLLYFGHRVWRDGTSVGGVAIAFAVLSAFVLLVISNAMSAALRFGNFVCQHHEAVHNLTVALALVVAGPWGLYLYRAQRQSEMAVADLDIKRLDLETRYLEQRRQPVVELDLSGTVLAVPGDRRPWLHVGAVISNAGGGPRTTTIRVVGDGLSVYAVSDHNDPEASERIGVVQNQYLASGCVLRPSGKCYADFVLPVSKPGLYYAVLKLEVPEDEAASVSKEAGLPEDTSFAWVRGVYVSAGPDTGRTQASSRD